MALLLIDGKEVFEKIKNSLQKMLDDGHALGPGGGYFEKVHADFDRIIKKYKTAMKQTMIDADKASRSKNSDRWKDVQNVYHPKLSGQIKQLKKDLRVLVEAYDREFGYSKDLVRDIWANFKDKLFEFMEKLVIGSGYYESID